MIDSNRSSKQPCSVISRRGKGPHPARRQTALPPAQARCPATSRRPDPPLFRAAEPLAHRSFITGTGRLSYPLAVRAIGSLNVSALRSALDALVIRHESLRTTFDLADGKPIQVVGKPRPVPFREVDLANCPDDEHESELRSSSKRRSGARLICHVT